MKVFFKFLQIHEPAMKHSSVTDLFLDSVCGRWNSKMTHNDPYPGIIPFPWNLIPVIRSHHMATVKGSFTWN